MSIALVLVVMLLAACGGDDDNDDNGDTGNALTPATESGQTQDTPVTTPAGQDAGDDDSDTTATQDSGTAPRTQTAETVKTPVTGKTPATTATTQPGGVGDNVYPAGDAGEVELRRNGDKLELIAVRQNDGWTHKVKEEDDDEIEIKFRQNSREIDFEAEIDNGQLKIDVCDKVIDPKGDVYTVGEAGEVEVRREHHGHDEHHDDHHADELTLVEVRPNDGWSYEVDTDDKDEIEVEFRRDNERLKFDLEIDDNRLEAKVCTRTVY